MPPPTVLGGGERPFHSRFLLEKKGHEKKTHRTTYPTYNSPACSSAIFCAHQMPPLLSPPIDQGWQRRGERRCGDGGGHEDGGPSPSSIDRVGDADDGHAVLVARRRDGGADAGAASPLSSPLSYHSPSGGVVRPVVRDHFWRVLEIDADDDDGDGEEQPRGHRRTSGAVARTTTDASRRAILEVDLDVGKGRGRGRDDGESSGGGGGGATPSSPRERRPLTRAAIVLPSPPFLPPVHVS
jgi:hypothetical protein